MMSNGYRLAFKKRRLLMIADNLHEGLRATAQQQAVHHLFVLQRQWGQLVGYGEDNMSVRRRKQLGAPRGQPAVARLSLAFWTMPVSTRNGELSITCLMGSNSLWGVSRPLSDRSELF